MFVSAGKKRLMEYLKCEVENLDSIEFEQRRREERLFPSSDIEAMRLNHNSNQMHEPNDLQSDNNCFQSSNGNS